MGIVKFVKKNFTHMKQQFFSKTKGVCLWRETLKNKLIMKRSPKWIRSDGYQKRKTDSSGQWQLYFSQFIWHYHSLHLTQQFCTKKHLGKSHGFGSTLWGFS